MLTVASDVANAAIEEPVAPNDLTQVMRRSVDEARQSVARTRDLMPVLREANVVDSGGMGLLTILEAMYLAYIGAELPTTEEVVVRAAPPRGPRTQPTAIVRSFLSGDGRSTSRFFENRFGGTWRFSPRRRRDPALVRVHLHTTRPGQAIDLALDHGTVEQVKIDDMQEQHDRLRGTSHPGHAEEKQCGLAVVSVGDGFANVYRSLGATILPGGETFNPSTRELLDELQAIHAREYVLLPNNRNVVLSAKQAGNPGGATGRDRSNPKSGRGCRRGTRVTTGPSSSEECGRLCIASSPTFNRARRHGQVRATVVDDRTIEAGDYLGIIDDRVDSIGSDPFSVSLQVLQSIGADTVRSNHRVRGGGDDGRGRRRASSARFREIHDPTGGRGPRGAINLPLFLACE